MIPIESGVVMKLERLSERVWYYPYEQERDRPNLGYIKGDNWSLAIDAGHSAAHTEEFYKALQGEGLPLPALTVLTHWHWDHTFAMHAVSGLCIANSRTNQYILDIRDRLLKEGPEFFLNMHESIRNEYRDNKEVIVTPADMVFDGELMLDLGSCPVRLFQAESPHTDDSTLIHIIDEKVLFIGDSNGGVFPTGEKNRELCEKLAATISSIDADICLEGHWTPDTPKGIVEDILS